MGETAWDRQRAEWARLAGDYDRLTAGVERRFLAATRPWIASRAVGSVLEVAIGTGANLAHYPPGVSITGLDLDATMLARARTKADALGRPVTLLQADAMALPFDDDTFDTVVCTYALCGVRDLTGAVSELLRVLAPGGRLLTADHVASTAWPVRWAQRGLEAITAPKLGEHWTRRPLLTLPGLGATVAESERRHVGVIELVHARRS